MTTATAPATGLDLLVLRRQAGRTQRELAVAMGVAKQRISQIELQWRPSRHVVERYVAALEKASAGE